MINTLFKTSKCLFTQLKPDGSSFYPSQDSDQGRENKKMRGCYAPTFLDVRLV